MDLARDGLVHAVVEDAVLNEVDMEKFSIGLLRCNITGVLKVDCRPMSCDFAGLQSRN